MNIQNALQFIRRLRTDRAVAAAASAIPPAELAERLPALGASLGCEFTLDDLQAAFAHDWLMRRMTTKPGF